ncbi:sensor histidine kinase [Egicoccus sp. AB-alg6-2]|uniref:sensor histidine kinase n=1 Tax=Egicoccus sp. AB-alg6-2 TaxID=3242692 RepID=UPI00359DE942
MNLPLGRDEAVLALACGVWAGYFLAMEVPGSVPAAALVAAGASAYRRRPVLAALALAALSIALQGIVGLSGENPGLLAAWFVAVYGLGRHTVPGRAIAPLTALVVAVAVADPTAPTILFGCVLLGSVWSFGAAVRRRTEAAHRAALAADQLAQVDPAARAAQAVAEERARLAGETLAVVRAAVVTMQAHAEAAAAALDPAHLEAIQVEGRRATSELRRLLGLLRSAPDSGAPAPRPTARPAWLGLLLAAVGLMALCQLEIVVTPDAVAPLSASTVGLSLLLSATVGLRRPDPGLACTAATMAPTLALVAGLTLPYGLWTGVAAGLLGWSVGTRGHLRDRAALGLFAGVLVFDVQRHHPGNEAMMLVVIALAVVAGHLWALRGHDERSATDQAAALRAEHEAATERAVRAERLRVAHELHDVTSHAVGVMVLQAGGAAAMREQDPDAAGVAVANVRAAGTQALSELELLFGLLDAGAIGPSGLAATNAPAGLRQQVEALVTRMQAAGLRVTLSCEGALPEQAGVAATAYRVVQEALTNVVRHAPRARAAVELTARAGVLQVTVRNDGAPRPPTTAEGPGFGLVGLEERVRADGGELIAAPDAAGGFVVQARLPLAAPPDRPAPADPAEARS